MPMQYNDDYAESDDVELGGDDGGETADGDEQEVAGNGTILRPLHWKENGVHPAWERDPLHRMKQTWDPTIRWGDETVIEIPDAAGLYDIFTKDLLNTQFNKSRGQTARLWFHGEVLASSGAAPVVHASQLEVVVGCGSQMTTIRKSYRFTPEINAPLDVSWEVPLQNIRGRVSARGNGVTLRFALWLVPIVGGGDEVL